MSDPGDPERAAAGVPDGGLRPPLVPGASAAPGAASPSARRAWLLCALPWLLALLLAALARQAPGAVERLYARGVYPRVAEALRLLSDAWAEGTGAALRPGSFPSLSEVLVAAGAAAVLVALRSALRAGGPAAAVRRAVLLGGSVVLAYLGLWGLNHAREPLAVTLALDVTGLRAEELDAVAARLEGQLAVDLAAPGTPLDGPAAAEAARAAWEAALEREPALGTGPCAVARPALSKGLVMSGISGIFSPFTQEAHVAGHLPEADLLFTACHEVAHAQGWAREDEANYLAWRVGVRSPSPALRRSARLVALFHVLRALGRADPSRLRSRMEGMDPRILEAQAERARFWDRERSPAASRAASAVNEAYLRSQGQEGVASYGRMVDLLVAEWRASGERFGVGDPR